MLKKLELVNFRSYKSFNIDFDAQLIAIIGPNAVGKTNLIESIYVSSTTKSFRARDRDLINSGNDFYKIKTTYDDTVTELRHIQNDNTHQKQAFVNGVKKPLTQLIGKFPVTLFEPNNLVMFYAGPAQRRQYLDSVLSQTSTEYLQALLQYRKIIKQRNSLLRISKRFGNKKDTQDQLFIYDLQLVDPINQIIKARLEFIEFISQPLKDYYHSIAGKNLDFDLHYIQTIKNSDIMLDLKDNAPSDIMAGFSTIGPHRDDIEVLLGGKPITQVVSRGEMRTFILSLKLAEIKYIVSQIGLHPTLLLDDVFSELDQNRRDHLLSVIKDQQVFITTTELDNIPHSSQIIDLSGVGNG